MASTEFYEDAGRSAKDQNRPQLQRLKADIAAGRINTVVVVKLDRITRSMPDFVDLWQFFQGYGTQILSLGDNFDTSGPMGEAMQTIVMVFAQLERQLTAERTRNTMNDRAERGLWNGGWITGYRSLEADPGKLIPDEEYAPIVRHIFDTAEKLGAAGMVHRQLLDRGILTPKWKSRKGNIRGGTPFSKQQVIKILRNRIYLGTVSWGKVNRENCHEPLITQEQFDRVQKMLDFNAKRRCNPRYSAGRVYPLRGLLRCSCGMMMTPRGSRGNGGDYPYYECTRKNHHGRKSCASVGIPAVSLEAAVIARISQLGTIEGERDEILAEAIRLVDDGVFKAATESDRVRRRMTALEAEQKNLLNVLKQFGTTGSASVQGELQRLETEHTALRQESDRLRAEGSARQNSTKSLQATIEGLLNLKELLSLATPEEQRSLLAHYVDVIEIDARRGSARTYAMKLLAGAPVSGGHVTGQRPDLLTGEAGFREVVEKAPRKEPSS